MAEIRLDRLWPAHRRDAPACPAAFPWFNTQRYWQTRILGLRALMDEPSLAAWILSLR